MTPHQDASALRFGGEAVRPNASQIGLVSAQPYRIAGQVVISLGLWVPERLACRFRLLNDNLANISRPVLNGCGQGFWMKAASDQGQKCAHHRFTRPSVCGR